MPNPNNGNTDNEPIHSVETEGQPSRPQITSETLQVLMANLPNQQNLPVTEDHVAEMLAQRRQINEYINKDNGRKSWDQKYYLTVGLSFILIISGLVIFTKPEYFTQVLSLIIGGFGGFGLGRATSKE